ncbi:hypothetical protein G6O67_008345 [Ophiocordyceps sinensis]|uniref:SCP domain-containing protein n=2 Tax=Ophiocordyceps sinensis TaxID=72228 RepID=A0A8H4PIP2_9HYPO|nr:CAP domain protein [Ophiocordyceps sinensis CO18]KAF4504158.1 hypothetical protein G6O67_008345 [Ophiocordyceps sinensis]
MRASLLLAAVPLAAALPHVQDNPVDLEASFAGELEQPDDPSMKLFSFNNSPELQTLPSEQVWGKEETIITKTEVTYHAESTAVELAPVDDGPPEAVWVQEVKQEDAKAKAVLPPAEDAKAKAKAAVLPPAEDDKAVLPPAENDKGDGAQSSTLTLYRTKALKLHNDARKDAKNEVELSWSEELEELSLEWAKQCNYRHSKNKPKGPGTVAENIAAQPKDMASNELAALDHSWTSWYNDELPYFNFDFNPENMDKETGHVRNILNPAFDQVGQASYLCPELRSEGETTVKKNWYFTVTSFSGPPS